MRVVVTGASGFAGTWLCRQLVASERVVIGWVRQVPAEPVPGVRYRVQDIRDREGCKVAMRADEPARVFHLAAMTHVSSCEADGVAAHDANVRGTHNVLSSMPAQAVGLFSSTCHVYGRPQRLPIDEHHPTFPVGTYARTKLEAEEVACQAHPKVVIARAFHHTGPGQASRYALAGWAEQLARDVRPIRVGDLGLRRDYTDVRDICRGYRLLLEKGQAHGRYNLCSGESLPLSELLRLLADGTPPETTQESARVRADDVPDFRGDPGRAKALGWRPEVTLSVSLAELRAGFSPPGHP